MNGYAKTDSVKVLREIVVKMADASGVDITESDLFITFNRVVCLQFYTDGHTFDQVQGLTEAIYDLWYDEVVYTDDVHFLISRK